MKFREILDFLLELIRIFKPNQRRWIVRVFIVAGIPLVSSRFWQPWIEVWLQKEFGFEVASASSIPGWILIALGVALYLFNSYQEREAKKEPTFTEDRENLNFSLGEGITCGYSVKQLRKSAATPFNLGGHLPVKVYLRNRKLYADVEVFSGTGLPSIKIAQNKLSGLPYNWDSNKNERALEVVDDKGNPVYQLIYKNDGHIILNGIFPFPGGLVLADDNHMTLNPHLPAKLELKRIFKYPSWKYPAVYET